MSHRQHRLRIVPHSDAPEPNPLHTVEAHRLPTGWTRVEVWREGEYIGSGDMKTADATVGFLACMADYLLGDRRALVIHDGAAMTGT